MTDEAMSPLRRRMIEDMAIRKLASVMMFSPASPDAYVLARESAERPKHWSDAAVSIATRGRKRARHKSASEQNWATNHRTSN